MFAGAKRESKDLHEELRQKCSIATSVNGWINKLLTLRWCNEFLGQFSFRRRLLAWDSFGTHLTEDVKKPLKLSKTETVIVLGGCPKYIQPLDLLWDKPVKGRIQELYDEYLANGKHEYTAAGNMKSVPRRLLVEWDLTWSEISSETIANSMKSYGLPLAINGSDDGLISCFKNEKK